MLAPSPCCCPSCVAPQVRHPNILDETFVDLDIIFGFVDTFLPSRFSLPCSQVSPCLPASNPALMVSRHTCPAPSDAMGLPCLTSVLVGGSACLPGLLLWLLFNRTS